jgi:hypothetical protein
MVNSEYRCGETIFTPSRKLKQQVRRARRQAKPPSSQDGDVTFTWRMIQAMSPDPFPLRKMCKMVYAFTTGATAPNTNLTQANQFSLNNCFDPGNLGAGAVQPYYYDQLAALYRAYIVHKADLEVTFFDPAADGLNIGIYLGQDTPVGLTWANFSQIPNTFVKTESNTGQQTVTFKFSLNPWDVVGMTRAQYLAQINNYGALTTASVVQNAFYWVVYQSSIAATATALKFNIKVVMHTEFWDRRVVAASAV